MMDLSNGTACAHTGESNPGTPADTKGKAEAARNSLRFTKLPNAYFLLTLRNARLAGGFPILKRDSGPALQSEDDGADPGVHQAKVAIASL
jgi:hypothetical protein